MGIFSWLGKKDPMTKGGEYYRSGKYERAADEFSKAVEANPANPFAYNERGRAYARAGLLRQAIADFEKVLQLPSSIVTLEASYNCALAYEKLQQYEKALQQYTATIELDHNHAAAWCNKGSVYVRLSEFEEAKKCFDEALRLNPNDIIALFNRAIVNQKLQEYDTVVGDLTKFLELAPTHHPNYPEAKQSLEQLSRLRFAKGQKENWMAAPKLVEPQQTGRGPQPKYLEHYETTSRSTSGQKHKLTLLQAVTVGPIVELAYRWEEDLAHQEADNLDTRARAYVACAIYDAALAAGISCRNGPPHGKRPSWLMDSENVPYSLMKAGFDTDDKVCWMHVGPIMGQQGRPMGSDQTAERLAKGFAKRFTEIVV